MWNPYHSTPLEVKGQLVEVGILLFPGITFRVKCLMSRVTNPTLNFCSSFLHIQIT